MAKVFLSAGHGGSDPGAVGNGMKEKDINLDIMLACDKYLKNHGVKTVLSRTKDENDPVTDEVKEANASKADVAVSFHTNAGGGDGSESLYHSSSAKGKKLAELCEKHVKAIGQNSRGIKERDGLWFLRGTNMVSVLCECAFIDNKKDKTIIDTKKERQKFGEAYAKAILDYLGISYKTENTKKETSKIEKLYHIQVAALTDKDKADDLVEMLKNKGIATASFVFKDNVYKVNAGSYAKKEYAETLLKNVKTIGFKDAFIKQY